MWRVLLVALTRVVTLWPIYVYWWLMVGGVFVVVIFVFVYSFFPFLCCCCLGFFGGMCDSLTYHNILLWYLFQVAILVRLQYSPTYTGYFIRFVVKIRCPKQVITIANSRTYLLATYSLKNCKTVGLCICFL